jgi:DNA-directed RNA polymerase subunit RPC12/RpoP
MSISAIHSINLGDIKGLSQKENLRSGGDQSIQCPNCSAVHLFRPPDFVWQKPEESFETVEVRCNDCGAEFELNAANDGGQTYDFFACQI